MNKQTINLIVNILLVFFLLGIAVYLFTHYEEVKLLTQDPCKVCEAKTNSRCSIVPYYMDLSNYSLSNKPDNTQDG